METLNNDAFFQSFVEELADKQVLLINKNKKNIVVRYDLWECVEKENASNRAKQNTENNFYVSHRPEDLRRAS